MSAAFHSGDYEDPGKWSALALAILMHGLLAFALLVSVKWQTRPQPVMAELWTPAAMPPIEAPAPEPEPIKETPPPIEEKVAPPQPPAPAKPLPPPDIKLKAKPEKTPPAETKKPPKLSFDEALAREESQLDRRKDDQERQRRAESEVQMMKMAREEQEVQQRKAARAKSEGDYIARIQGKIRGNIVRPPNLKGNPVAQLVVSQLPTGEILDVKLKRSSGNPQYDDAVERAIRKSSPLPRPDDTSVFSRELVLTFCPDEERGCAR